MSNRKLRLQSRPPVLADPNLVWGVPVRQPMTAERIVPGFQTILMGNRQALHTVTYLLFWLLKHHLHRPSRSRSFDGKMDIFFTWQLVGPSPYGVPVVRSPQSGW